MNHSDVLPVGVQPLDGETRASFVRRLAAANHLAVPALSRALLAMPVREAARSCRLPIESIEPVLSVSKRSRTWDSQRWDWHCPQCRARTGAEIRYWQEAEYTACPNCRTLLVPGARPEFGEPLVVSDEFLETQDALRKIRSDDPIQWEFLRTAFITVTLDLDENWPPVLSDMDAALRAVAVEHKRELPITLGEHPSPALRAAVLHSTWQHTRTIRAYEALMDPIRSPRLASARHFCGCPASSDLEPGHEHFTWRWLEGIRTGSPSFAEQLQELRATDGLSSRHVPAHYREPHEPIVPEYGRTYDHRDAAAYLLHACLSLMETDGTWRPPDTLLAFDIPNSRATSPRWHPHSQCSIKAIDYAHWSLVHARIGGRIWNYPHLELLDFARQLIDEGLVDYQYRRDAMWRARHQAWPGQHQAVFPDLSPGQLKKLSRVGNMPQDHRFLQKRPGGYTAAASWIWMYMTGGYCEDASFEIGQRDAPPNTATRLYLQEMGNEILFGAENLVIELGEAGYSNSPARLASIHGTARAAG